MERLPKVTPWSGVSAVSPWTTFTRASGTDNSSAAIWVSAVRTPVPRSTLPEKTVTLPAPSMARNPSTWSSATVFSFLAAAGEAASAAVAASASFAPTTKVTTRDPPAFRNSRRPRRARVSGMELSSRPSGLPARGGLHGAHDAEVGATAAQVVGQRGADLGLGGMRLRREQGRRLHDHAVDAVAALCSLLLDERLLQRVRLLGRTQALERDHLLPLCCRRRVHTGADRLAVEVHGAGPALRETATETGAVQPQIVAQHVQKRRGGVVQLDRSPLPVDGEPDGGDRCSFLGVGATTGTLAREPSAPQGCPRQAPQTVAGGGLSER